MLHIHLLFLYRWSTSLKFLRIAKYIENNYYLISKLTYSFIIIYCYYFYCSKYFTYPY